MLALAFAVRFVIAAAIFLAIAFVGLSVLGAVTSGRPRDRIEPEDVAELDVFFVCGECGTEFQVTKLGEIQVPRHCGEPMRVERRPRQQSGTE